jgi:hypothetical protein
VLALIDVNFIDETWTEVPYLFIGYIHVPFTIFF